MLAPPLGEAFFYLVCFRLPASPAKVPAEVLGCLWFANSMIGVVVACWMTVTVVLARGPFQACERRAWQARAWPLPVWYTIDTAFTPAYGVWVCPAAAPAS
jgi:hypothetical protein